MLLPLRWIAILYNRIKLDLALTSGVHNGKDIAKAVLAGSSAVMTAAELLVNGIDRAAEMIKNFE